jgi:putative two-component system response regulator
MKTIKSLQDSLLITEKASILLLEDDPFDVEQIKIILDKSNIQYEIKEVLKKDDFIKYLNENNIDLILADYSIPGFDGIEALNIAQQVNPFIPFIFVSGVMKEEFAIECLNSGATDYVFKTHMKRLIPTILRALRESKEIRRRKIAEEIARESYIKLSKVFEEIVVALSSIAEKRDPYTAGHQRNVSKIACEIAKVMGLPQDKIEGLKIAGILHDIGKVYVPSEILNKPGRLTDLEFSIIKTHSQVGYEIIKEIDFPWPVADMVLQHHERLDGSGYPGGLIGEDMLIESKILTVADVLEAMSSHRPYRAALGIELALNQITMNSGIFYDKSVVDCCVSIFKNKNKLEEVINS